MEKISLERIHAHSIDSNTMNAQLKDLYESVLSSYGKTWRNHYDMQTDEVHGDYPANPYFITVQDAYSNADHRIMVIGQETYSWGDEFGDCGGFSLERNVDELMSLYDICIKDKRLNTTFWQFGRALAEDSGSQVLFNNIAKVGWCGKRGFLPSLQPRILQKEMEITKPDLLVFTTGPSEQYMQELNQNGICPSGRESLVSIDGKAYAEIWEGVSVPTIWCYHPRYLSIRKVIKSVREKAAEYIASL